MEFDAASQALKCPNCGTVIPIINDQSKVVEHTLNRASMNKIRVTEKTSHTMECKSCGAKVEVEATCTATECPYCGSTYVLADKQEDVVIPDGVIPFQIDQNRVGEIFRDWIKKRWLAPGALKNLYQRGKLQGVYLPYWTFDAQAKCYYTAQGGRTRTETYKDKDGETRTRTHTDWYFTSGTVNNFFDDVLVRASQKLDSSLLARIEPFQTDKAASYSPEYFSGYEAECCSRDLQDAHKEARQKMEHTLHQMAEQDVLRRFDSVRDVRLRPEYSDETYKQLILPIYSTAYDFKGKQYTVLINGQTGSIRGGYPKSPAKIILLAAGAVAAFILIYWLLWGNEGSGSAYLPDPEPGYTIEETYGQALTAKAEAGIYGQAWTLDAETETYGQAWKEAAPEPEEDWEPVTSSQVFEW